MSESIPSLKDLFLTPEPDAGEETRKTPLLALHREVEQELPQVPWKSVGSALDERIEAVLDVGVDELLIAAWKKYRGFQRYADPEQYPPGETVMVPLAEHTIRSAHRPHVDLKLHNVELGSLELRVELELDLEGVVLEIEGGKIWALRAGSCRGAGKMACAVRSRLGTKELLRFERETPKLELGGARFAEGIAIPPPERQTRKAA